ncbi:VOC family protein [Pseudomonas sp. LFM046]|uniref:VOC family protein n=1 Tax=Pseudomonas sp. LFM046 TaxID=1608357 RepID=UPI0005CFB67C|nr:VOC family protein [Pseudomonas sp. LFM046]
MAGSTAIPCLRYRDAPAAITWLCNTFGFVEHLVVAEKDGVIAHAQLSLDGGMIMLGSVRNNAYGELLRQPDESGGLGSQGIYLVVANVDAVHARALAAGATIVLPLKDEDYGGRGFTCRDPEGHLWSIGSYDPWG